MNLRIEYREEMKSLQMDIARMGAIIEKALDNVMKTMACPDGELIRRTIAMDDDVDAMEAGIEKRCIRLLLRQTPAAGELRDVLSILKIITDLERIGDHCEDICEWILKINPPMQPSSVQPLPVITQKVKEMLKATIDSFVERDAGKAMEVCRWDDSVDDLYNQLIQDQEKQMRDNPDYVHNGVIMISIAKYLERMADHATNICEWIMYDVTGRHEILN